LLLTLCEEVFVRFWGEDPWPAFEVVFFEELRCVLAGGFDFFKLVLDDGNEARFGFGGHSGSSVVGLLRAREAFLW
jgi:hypothetical protein